MVNQQQLAYWIKSGLRNERAVESHNDHIKVNFPYGCHCCVLGLALVGKLGSIGAALSSYEFAQNGSTYLGYEKFASLLQIPFDLALEISNLHRKGVSAEAISNVLSEGLL